MSWTDENETDKEHELRKELVEMILLNKDRKVRIRVELRDEEGNVIPTSQVSKDLLEYVDGKFEEDGAGQQNTFISQIYPMLANILASTLSNGLTPNTAAMVLTNEFIKESFMMTMCVSFLLLQYIKQNNYTIHTVEEALTDEQIESYNTRTLISSIAGKAAALGIDFKLALAVVWKQGNITLDQISEALGYVVTESDLTDLVTPQQEDKEDESN